MHHCGRQRFASRRVPSAALAGLQPLCPQVLLPLIVRTDVGTHHIGCTPPAGPGNQWARPLREEW